MNTNCRIVFLAGPMRGFPTGRLSLEERDKETLEPQFKVLHAYRGRENKETLLIHEEPLFEINLTL